MEQMVEIPVEIRGMEQFFVARVRARRYDHRCLVDVDAWKLQWSGMMPANSARFFQKVKGRAPEKEIIAAIVDALQTYSISPR